VAGTDSGRESPLPGRPARREGRPASIRIGPRSWGAATRTAAPPPTTNGLARPLVVWRGH